MPGTAPISNDPYRMALIERKELKEQLEGVGKRALLDPVCHRGEPRFYS